MPRPKPAATTEATYAELLEELQAVTDKLEAGELDVDQAVSHYERGLELTKQLEARLNQAENRLNQLRAD